MSPPPGSPRPEVRGWRVEVCEGGEGCPNRAAAGDTLPGEIGRLLARRRLGEPAAGEAGAARRRRRELVVALADCPNACSRPQIADVGFIAAAEPRVTAEVCHQCLGCVHACREGAVIHPGLLPIIDPAACVRCGQCARSCVSGTIQVGRRGWRMQVGGRLGRHPRLAVELPGVLDRAGVLAALDCVLDHYLAHDRGGERLGAILGRTGVAPVAACVKERASFAGEEPVRAAAPILRGPV